MLLIGNYNLYQICLVVIKLITDKYLNSKDVGLHLVAEKFLLRNNDLRRFLECLALNLL